jgi:hypothetical protein
MPSPAPTIHQISPSGWKPWHVRLLKFGTKAEEEMLVYTPFGSLLKAAKPAVFVPGGGWATHAPLDPATPPGIFEPLLRSGRQVIVMHYSTEGLYPDPERSVHRGLKFIAEKFGMPHVMARSAGIQGVLTDHIYIADKLASTTCVQLAALSYPAMKQNVAGSLAQHFGKAKLSEVDSLIQTISSISTQIQSLTTPQIQTWAPLLIIHRPFPDGCSSSPAVPAMFSVTNCVEHDHDPWNSVALYNLLVSSGMTPVAWQQLLGSLQGYPLSTITRIEAVTTQDDLVDLWMLFMASLDA